jgi:murein DD-endopeptidase MepM/ murein hydrolase activator NlpD
MKLPIRKTDQHGCGEYYASRGNRKHNGIDIISEPFCEVKALADGIVTKIGYPYNPALPDKGHLRYVQVSFDDVRVRYFYVNPLVVVGQIIRKGDVIGMQQDLTNIYPGITNHYHLEALIIVARKKIFLNPVNLLEAWGYDLA